MNNDKIIEAVGIFEKDKGFKLDEAIDLMYLHVARKDELNESDNRATVELTGYVCGILHVNDDIELVLKFLHGLTQANKREFEKNFKILDEL